MGRPSFHRARQYAPHPTAELASWLFDVVSAALLVCLLLLLGWIAELLFTGGDVRVRITEQPSVQRFTPPPTRTSPQFAEFNNRGLLPVVWRLRDTRRGNVVAQFYANVSPLRSNVPCLVLLLAAAVSATALRSLAVYLSNRLAYTRAERTTWQLRRLLQRQALQLEGAPPRGWREKSVAELFDARVEQLRTGLVAWWQAIPRAPLTLAALIALALFMQVWVALAAILLCLLCGWILATLNRQALHYQRLAADRASKHLDHLIERLRKVRLARSYLLDDLPGEQFDAKLSLYRREALTRDNADAAILPLAEWLIALGAALLLFATGINLLAEPARLSITEMFVLYAALLCGYRPLRQLLRLRQSIPTAESAARAVLTYLDREPTVGQPSHAQKLPRLSRAIELDHVTLARRSGQQLLDAIQLRISAGSHVALVASDDAVPPAVAQLLVRLREPAAGRILFDGVDLRTATLESLRGQVGLVLKDGLLFTSTVRDNIRCAHDRQFTAEQITAAAKTVEAHSFIERLPQGLDTIVGDHGMQLDPFEAWQIGLARAVLRQPSVLVLQEPTAELTPAHSAQCDRLLDRLAQNRTLIVLPARLASLRHAQQVYVIHHGKLHAQGTHAELLQSSDLYRHLQYLRFNEFRHDVR